MTADRAVAVFDAATEFDRFVARLVPATTAADSGSTFPVRAGSRGPRLSVTSEDVIEAASHILDKEGIRALTARRIAADMGISTRTLYKRVRCRDSMIRGIADGYAARFVPVLRHGNSWKYTVMNWCTDLHAEMLSHPHLTGLLGDRIPGRIRDSVEDLVNVAISEGVSRKHAVEYCGTVVDVTVNDALALIHSTIHELSERRDESRDAPSASNYRDAINLILGGVSGGAAGESSPGARRDPLSHSDNEARNGPEKMNRAQESALTWALVDIARPLLTDDARTWLCAQIGAGEYRRAIENILTVMCRRRAEVPAELARQLRAWLSGYAGSDSEADLRNLIDDVPTSTVGRRPSRVVGRLSRAELSARAGG